MRAGPAGALPAAWRLAADAHQLPLSEGLVAELPLCGANGLGGHDAVDDASVVVDLADARRPDVALAFALDVLKDVVDHGEIASRRVEAGGCQVPGETAAGGSGTGRYRG